MLKNILCKSLISKPNNARQLYKSAPTLDGGKVFNSREKAAEGVWARQMNNQELEKLYHRLKEQQKILQDTQSKLSELRKASLNENADRQM